MFDSSWRQNFGCERNYQTFSRSIQELFVFRFRHTVLCTYTLWIYEPIIELYCILMKRQAKGQLLEGLGDFVFWKWDPLSIHYNSFLMVLSFLLLHLVTWFTLRGEPCQKTVEGSQNILCLSSPWYSGTVYYSTVPSLQEFGIALQRWTYTNLFISSTPGKKTLLPEKQLEGTKKCSVHALPCTVVRYTIQ